jgi:hypothetical protein
MEPNKKVINEKQESVTETPTDQQIENKNIARAPEQEGHMPDVTGLNTDTFFVHDIDDMETDVNKL